MAQRRLPPKVYLGDAVYAELDRSGSIVLTTENGIETTNQIYLEEPTIMALERYIEQCKEYCTEARGGGA